MPNKFTDEKTILSRRIDPKNETSRGVLLLVCEGE
jgi:hypothetical protein